MYRIALLSDTAAQDMIPSLVHSATRYTFPLDTAHTAPKPDIRPAHGRCPHRPR